MAEYASKGVAGTGLGLGIAGTALALLQNDNGNGILGGLLGGGNNNRMTELMNENTLLKAQQYTDNKLTPIIVEQTRQGEQIHCLNNQIALREQITDGKIAQATLVANNGITQLQGALACLQRTVDGIASTYVPAGKVTPLPAPNPWPPIPPYSPYWPPFPPFPPPVPPTTTTGGTTTDPGTATTGG